MKLLTQLITLSLCAVTLSGCIEEDGYYTTHTTTYYTDTRTPSNYSYYVPPGPVPGQIYNSGVPVPSSNGGFSHSESPAVYSSSSYRRHVPASSNNSGFSSSVSPAAPAAVVINKPVDNGFHASTSPAAPAAAPAADVKPAVVANNGGFSSTTTPTPPPAVEPAAPVKADPAPSNNGFSAVTTVAPAPAPAEVKKEEPATGFSAATSTPTVVATNVKP